MYNFILLYTLQRQWYWWTFGIIHNSHSHFAFWNEKFSEIFLSMFLESHLIINKGYMLDNVWWIHGLMETGLVKMSPSMPRTMVQKQVHQDSYYLQKHRHTDNTTLDLLTKNVYKHQLYCYANVKTLFLNMSRGFIPEKKKKIWN